jgi:hypothetical protein
LAPVSPSPDRLTVSSALLTFRFPSSFLMIGKRGRGLSVHCTLEPVVAKDWHPSRPAGLLQFRWTRQSSPAMRNLEHRFSAA